MQSAEVVDNYIEGIVAATWNHQLRLHQFMPIIKLCNTWLTLNGINTQYFTMIKQLCKQPNNSFIGIAEG